MVLYELLPLGAQRQVLASFLVKARDVVVDDRLLHDAPGRFRPEVIFAVELLHPLDQFAAVEPGIDDVRKLMAALIRHRIDRDQVVRLDVIVELGAGIRMRDRDLNRLRVQALGEIDRVAEALAAFAGQADDEVARGSPGRACGSSP